MTLGSRPFLALMLVLACTCGPALVSQTLTDNFSDGNLENPNWTGDVADFLVRDGQLQLMAAAAGTSLLELPLPPVDPATTLDIGMFVRMDFAPSSGNFTDFALLDCTGSDCAPVGTIRIGGVSGSDDRIEVRLVAVGETLTLNGAPGAVGTAPAMARFSLRRQDDQWTLWTDYTGEGELQLEDTGRLAGLSFNRFQLRCTYTSTRTDRFVFDDFAFTATSAPDTLAPRLTEAVVLDNTTIALAFSETLASATAENMANYRTAAPAPPVASVVAEESRVRLQFANDLPANMPFSLSLTGLQDPAGNMLADTTLRLVYRVLAEPTTDNVVLNEFMADPTPVRGLPDAEYVELYNPTEEIVDASRLALASGGTPVALPAGTIIPARGYLVVAENEAAQVFEQQGVNTVGLRLPSLSNSGDVITVFGDGQVLQEITYTLDWYNDPERDAGGYSLEYTGGADAGCGGNWKSSEDLTGGTPGRLNTVRGRLVDTLPPQVTGLEVWPDRVELRFSEALTAAQITGGGLFAFDQGAAITGIALPEPDRVVLTTRLEEGVVYTLTIFPDFSDCAGNFPPAAQHFPLAIPARPAAGEVAINEILFNPASGGSDFVELFNCSDKVFQLAGWRLQNRQSSASTSERLVTASRLFLPGTYLVLTADTADLAARYPNVRPEYLLEQPLPSLPNDMGNFTLFADGVVLDAFDYTADFHSELISDENGVSLERIRTKALTQDANNWFSAAQSAGFATPTQPNSQQRDQLPAVGAQTFSLVRPTFSPDGDAFEDLLEIQYATDRPGFLTRVRIFDMQGRLVRTLRQTELLAGSGTLRWDGSNDEGRRARAGAYVLLLELFHPDGEVREEKLVAVLAAGR